MYIVTDKKKIGLVSYDSNGGQSLKEIRRAIRKQTNKEIPEEAGQGEGPKS